MTFATFAVHAAPVQEPDFYEINIKHNGMWPFTWSWDVVQRRPRPIVAEFIAMRSGDALTKDRARRKALKAKASMETEDVTVTYP